MGEKVFVQCQCCGKIHQVKSREASISDDDLYTEPIWCSRCRDGTKHILIGDQADTYIYANNNLDERFFIY